MAKRTYVQGLSENPVAKSLAPGTPCTQFRPPQEELICRLFRVSEGTRTPDRLDHNQELYQLSYAHRGTFNVPGRPREESNLRPAA